MIIDSNGKARCKNPLLSAYITAFTKYFEQAFQQLNKQMDDELKKLTPNKATGDALDRLYEIHGIVREK